MPIVLKHEAAGITPNPENPRLKYGMTMALQQQRADQEMRQRAQDAQYDMQRMGAMGAMREMREPSIGEDDAMLEQEIRGGMYDPDTVRSMREDQRAMRMILADRNIDATQRSKAIDNLRSRMRMARSTGRVQPMQQPMPQQVGPMALQTKPPMTEAEYFEDPVRYKDSRAAAMQQIEAANGVLNEDNIHAQMHNNYLAREKFLQNPGGFAAPQGQGQSAAQPPNAPAAAPAANPQASYTGGQSTFGASPVLAQGGFQQNAPVGQSAYQPTGSYSGGDPVFGASPVLANPSQQQSYDPAAQQGRGYISIAPQQVQRQPQYPIEAVAETKVDPGYMGKPSSDYMSNRTFRSADGRTMIGSIVGINPPAASGGFSTVQIKKESDGKVYDVPLNNLSQQDQQFVLSGGNRDTQYALQNPQMSAGQAYFDPNNPVRQEMSAADQSIVNPQKRTLGSEYKGRYGLGGADFGINPSTGNRVTASVRPGGTMLEYDEPIGPPGTAMAGRKGSVTWQGRKGKKNDMVSPGEQWSNANPYPAQTPVAQKPVEPTQAPAPMPPTLSRNDPKVQEALRIAADPKATGAQIDAIIPTLRAANISMDEIKQIDAKRGNAPPMIANQQSSQRKPWGSQEDVLAIPGQFFDAASEAAVAVRRKMLGFPASSDQPAAASSVAPQATSPVARKPTMAELEGGARTPTMADLEGGVRSAPEVANPASSSLLNQLEQADRDVSQTENAPSEQENVRTWTDKNGKTFEGSIVERSIEAASKQPVGQQVITVKRKDGQVFNIPVSRLSDEDVAYLEAAFKVFRYLDGYDWTTGNTIKVGKGKASKYEKPTTEQKKYPSRSGPMSKSYRGEIPEEVLQKPPSSSRSVTGKIS